MKRLQEHRIEQLSKYLQVCKLDPKLLPEILDHLACEAEERLWDGKSFDEAFNSIREIADSRILLDLNVDHRNLLAKENSLNDIVFEGRNKLYGAYDLRKGYGHAMQRATILGVTFFLLVVMLPTLYARLTPDPKPRDVAYEVEFKDVTIIADSKTAPKEFASANITEQPTKATVISELPEVKVDIEHVPLVLGELGSNADEVASFDPRTRESKSGIVEIAGREKEYVQVEQMPEFLGGNIGMGAFLQRYIQYPAEAVTANIEGKVLVEFTVGKDGKIENVKPIKGIGFGCDEEAVRVVKLMPDWKPGKQGGAPVKVRFTLPITFQME